MAVDRGERGKEMTVGAVLLLVYVGLLVLCFTQGPVMGVVGIVLFSPLLAILIRRLRAGAGTGNDSHPRLRPDALVVPYARDRRRLRVEGAARRGRGGRWQPSPGPSGLRPENWISNPD